MSKSLHKTKNPKSKLKKKKQAKRKAVPSTRKPKAPAKPVQGNEHGLYAKNFARPLRDLIDQDYAHLLSTEERQLLAKFNDEFYGARFGQKPLHKSREHRRELEAANNHLRNDVYALSKAVGNLDYPDASDPNNPDELQASWEGLGIVAEGDLLPEDPAFQTPAIKAARALVEDLRPPLPVDGRRTVSNPPARKEAIRKLAGLNGEAERQAKKARKGENK